MQWLCLFAVLLVLYQPAEAGGNEVCVTINETDTMNIAELKKVTELLTAIRDLGLYMKNGYLGCYEDSTPRLLPTVLNIVNVTSEKCIKACAAAGHKYAGTEFAKECFCGNRYDAYPKKPDSECNYKCSGNNAEMCGGFLRISVYATGK